MSKPDASPILERFTPKEDQTRSQLHFEHLHRYHFAAQFVKHKRVLDIASGSGYGSALLGREGAESVLGVDIAVDAVSQGNQRYASSRVRFIVGDCASIPLPDKSVDVVISFETVEHIENQDRFFSEIDRVLSDSGILILSSPDRDFYRRTLEPNAFHVRELTLAELQSTISKRFPHFRILGQKLVAGSAILPLGSDSDTDSGPLSLVQAGPRETRRHRYIDAPPYLIVVASRQPLPSIQGELYEEEGVTPIIWDVYERGQSLVGQNLDHKIRELGDEVERRGVWGLDLQKRLNEVLLENKQACRNAEEERIRFLAEKEAALAAATRRFAEMRLSLESGHADELKAALATAANDQIVLQQKLERAAEVQAAVSSELDRKNREIARILSEREAALAAFAASAAEIRVNLERTHLAQLEAAQASAASERDRITARLDDALREQNALITEVERTRLDSRLASHREGLIRAELEERIEKLKQQVAQAAADASQTVAQIEQGLGKQLSAAEEQLLSALTAARSSALESSRLARELEIARSKWALAESDAARTRNIEGSLSWKITGPLRRVHEWLGNPFCR